MSEEEIRAAWRQLGRELDRRLRVVERVLRQVVEHVRLVWDSLRRTVEVVDPRMVLAPDLFDDVDGSWQSPMCDVWLHSSCELPDWCECTCHGGCRR